MGKADHDWLERRFENMTAKECLLFAGALALKHPERIDRAMELANQLPRFDLYYGAGDNEALGRFVLEYLERPSPKAVPFLHVGQVGAAYQEQDRGIFCQGHYLRRSSPTVPRPEEPQLLQPVVGDYAIRVKLASRSNMDGVWVGFPDTGEHMDVAYPDELLLGLDALQAETLQECIVLEVDCCLPQLRDIPSQYDSAGELVRHAIDFGYAWAEQGQGEPHWLDKWQAVLELEDCHRLDQALDYAQNLKHYAVIPRGVDLAEYGRELAIRNGIIPKTGLLADCFDSRAYTVTADYTGTVSRIALNQVRYVAIFEGTPIQPFPMSEEGTPLNFDWMVLLVPFGVVILVSACIGGALFLRHRRESELTEEDLHD